MVFWEEERYRPGSSLERKNRTEPCPSSLSELQSLIYTKNVRTESSQRPTTAELPESQRPLPVLAGSENGAGGEAPTTGQGKHLNARAVSESCECQTALPERDTTGAKQHPGFTPRVGCLLPLCQLGTHSGHRGAGGVLGSSAGRGAEPSPRN